MLCKCHPPAPGPFFQKRRSHNPIFSENKSRSRLYSIFQSGEMANLVMPFRLLFQPPSRAAVFFGNSKREHFTQQNLILGSDDDAGDNVGAGFARNFSLTLDKAVTHRGRFATVHLHFSAKWIMVSEVAFATSEDAGGDMGGDNEPERISEPALPDNEQKVSQMEEQKTHHVRAREPSSDASPVVLPEEEQKRELSPNNGEQDAEDDDDDDEVASSVDSSSSSYPSIVYVGLVIGVLSATVLLLLATILVMLRRNKQRVFIKQEQRRQQQLQQQMLGQQLGPGGMMRQLTPMSFVKTPADLDAMTLASNSKLYEDAALISGAVEDIYHEPSYPRLVLQRPLQGPSTFRWSPVWKADLKCVGGAKQLFYLSSFSETAAAGASATTTSRCTSSDSSNSTLWHRPPDPRPSWGCPTRISSSRRRSSTSRPSRPRRRRRPRETA